MFDASYGVLLTRSVKRNACCLRGHNGLMVLEDVRGYIADLGKRSMPELVKMSMKSSSNRRAELNVLEFMNSKARIPLAQNENTICTVKRMICMPLECGFCGQPPLYPTC